MQQTRCCRSAPSFSSAVLPVSYVQPYADIIFHHTAEFCCSWLPSATIWWLHDQLNGQRKMTRHVWT